MIEAVSMVIVQPIATVQDIEHRMAETQETCFPHSVSSGNREAAGPLLMTILHS